MRRVERGRVRGVLVAFRFNEIKKSNLHRFDPHASTGQ